MKGIELPINVLIIIAIAVIVLIALVSMFYPAFSSSSGTVSLDMAKSQACRALVEGNSCGASTNKIRIYNFDADQDKNLDPGIVWCWAAGNPDPVVCAAGPANTCKTGTAEKDNLGALCACYYQISGATAENDCKRLCGC